MVDREKVVEGLELSYKYSNVDENNTLVPQWIVLHALALLKAQEPVEYVVHCNNADLSNGTEFACGECGGLLLHKKVNYCPWCGRAVKWE